VIHKRLLPCAALLLMLAVVSSPAAVAQTATPAPAAKKPTTAAAAGHEPKGRLTILSPTIMVGHPDPIIGGQIDMIILGLLYDPMIGFDPTERKVDPAYGAVTRWEVSPDGLEYTFHLRRGINFTNGQPLTAEDMKFSLLRYFLPEAKSEAAPVLKALLKDKQLTVVGPHTLKVRLATRSATWLTEISPLVQGEMVLPNEYVQKVGIDGFAKAPVGSGPYVWDGAEPHKYVQVRYSGTPHWKLGVPYWKEVRWESVPEESTRIAMLRSGQADIVEVSRDKVAELKKAGFQIVRKEKQMVIGFYLHNLWDKSTFLADQNVREAMALAVDKQLIFNTLLNGLYGSPWGVTWPPPFDLAADRPDYQQTTATPDPFDPEKAKAILRNAGYKPGQIKLTLASTNRFPEQGAISEAVAKMLQNVGIDVKLETMESAVWFGKWNAGQLPNTITIMQTSNRLVAIGGAINVFTTDGSLRLIKDDPEIDTPFYNARGAKTLDEYKHWMVEGAKVVRRKQLVPGFFALDRVYAVSPKLPAWDLGVSRFGIGLRDLVYKAPKP
jgi:peptide/nickel transport system substrate-binding protein